jgi:predicted metal-dependent phosphoesterase TrpH
MINAVSPKRADLHTHSTASDGTEDPQTVVDLAYQAGLSAIAIADHDTIDGFTRLTADSPLPVRVVPAIEMSANVGDAEVHILGYFIDPASGYLAEQLAQLQRQRLRRIERFCDRLTAIGLPLTVDDVLSFATGNSIGRPHIARALIARGYVESVGDAFDRYLAGGRPGFVPRDDMTPERAIEIIHGAGGVASLAHPFTTGDPVQTVERLHPAGLDGMEVEYGAYAEQDRAVLRSLAASAGLIATGGSDFHGREHRSDVPLGSGSVSLDTVAALETRAERYHQTRS